MGNILRSQEDVDVLAHVADNLRRLRAAAGLNQSALAKVSGVSRRMIVAVEGGDANISVSSLDKLAAAIGVPFVELVRDPSRDTRENINAVTWRGTNPQSMSVLMAAVPATSQAELWSWTLGPGERYEAEPDPQGWHDMIVVTEGVLTLELAGASKDYAPGGFAVYSSARPHAFVNHTDKDVKFFRNTIS
ncbi:helix-turn-helix domain-containing protein [Paracoccus pacificus]|uniref:Helix-turn-helix domain-containing protein n=1 Tax=Paracoccus pacificus TaxID=1463598 RepID=A0ABW4RBH1_9RHOB